MKHCPHPRRESHRPQSWPEPRVFIDAHPSQQLVRCYRWASDVKSADIEAYEDEAKQRCASMRALWGNTRLVETFSKGVRND